MPFANAVFIDVPDATVSHLVIDATNAGGSALRAPNNGTTRFASNVEISHNTVTCGSGSCLFFSGVLGATISDNTFVSGGSGTGVHIQGQGGLNPDGSRERPVDGTRVTRNTIVAEAPSTIFPFGGIRIRDGADVLVAQNRIEGPWTQSIATAALQNSEFSGNRGQGAQAFGLTAFFSSRRFDGHTIRNNHFSGGGSGGVFLSHACGNTFVGNNFNGNADDTGIIFEVDTGANTVVGNNNVVIDNGDFDCDGDGNADPNVIGGAGAVLAGVNLGHIVSQVTGGSDASGLH